MNKENLIKVTLLGDIMLDHTQIPLCMQHGFDIPFSELSNEFVDSDLVIGNLETPLSRNKENYSDRKYLFCAPEDFALAIKKAIPNLLLLTANNHCLDKGLEVLKETIAILDDLKIPHTGTNAINKNEYFKTMIKGVSIGVLNYTYGTNAFNNHQYLKANELGYVNLLQPQELSNPHYRKFLASKNIFVKIIRRICIALGLFQINTRPYERVSLSKSLQRKYLQEIHLAKKENDVIISCLHIGGQYNSEPAKYTKFMIKKSIKSGADIVSANHEHVVHPFVHQPQCFYNYSLGNFLGTNGVSMPPYDKKADISIAINVYINADTKEKKYTYSIFKVVQNQMGISVVYPLYKLIEEYPNQAEFLEIHNQITLYLSGNVLKPSKEYEIK